MKFWLAFYLTLLFLLPVPVSAHTLESDNTVGAVLHIDPDDNPRVGQSQGFVLAFRDKTGQFDLPGCDCRYTLTNGDQTIFSESLNAQDKTNSVNYYTFGQAGVYRFQVTGKPQGPANFQQFELDFDIRVIGANGNSSQYLVPTLLSSLALLQLFVLLGVVYKFKRRKK